MKWWISLVVFSMSLYGFAKPLAPFGKDSDLTEVSSKKEASTSYNPLFHIAQKAIAFHQNNISPVQGERSHFKPSSSEYTKQAINKYGFLKGFIMGCDRLMRENDESWVYDTKIIGDRVWKFDPP